MHLLVKHNVLEFRVPLSSATLSENVGEFGAKKYLEDRRTANRIQLLVLQKEIFLNYSFSEQVVEKGEFSKDYLRDVATCFFTYR